MSWHPIVRMGQLEEQQPLALTVAGRKIAVCKIDGICHAFSNVCTHQNVLLTDGFVEGNYIECPLHHGRFDIPTGKALNPPVVRDIEVFELKREADQLLVWISSEQQECDKQT